MNRLRHFLLLALLLAATPAPGGGGPLNTLVVVNRSSRNSRALGTYYAEKHGLPPSHICSIKTNPRAHSITRGFFESEIRAPILAHIAREKLDGQIHYVVFSLDIPTRVDNFNGLTGALFYGFKPATPKAPRCHIAADSVNQYYGAEIAYTSTAGWNQTNAPIPFVLTAENLKIAKQVVDRAAAANAKPPVGLFCMHGTSNNERNIRHFLGPALSRQFALMGWSDRLSVLPPGSEPPAEPLIGYITGRSSLPTQFVELVMAPGAIADHLTSCAGILPDACEGQSTVWEWMRLGATASYGTVSEPCNFREKFPDPLLFFWYARGFTAGEALAMSVRNPYQGIWVGDPLAAPFAKPPAIEILEPGRHATLSGETLLKLRLGTHEDGAPPVFADLYLDGRHHAPIARPFSPVGNHVSAQIGTNRFTYVVAPGEDLFAAVAGLAWAINVEGGGRVTAQAHSDRLEVTSRQPLDPDGEPLAFAVTTEQGFGKGLYIEGAAGTGHLVVEDQVGRAMALFHLGSVRSYDLEYTVDLSHLPPGPHSLTVVARDGTAVQAQSQATLPFHIVTVP